MIEAVILPFLDPEYWRGLPVSTFWIWCLGATVLGFGGLYLFRRSLIRARTIEDVPTSRIRSASQGYNELIGTGRNMPGPQIVSPLSGQPCLWYRYQIDERTFYGNSGERGWKTIERSTSDGLFLIEDGTGECIVDPEGAQVIPHFDRRWYGDSMSARNGGWTFTAQYRFREQRIEKGYPLYVIGDFRTLGSPSCDMQDNIADVLRELKKDPQRMHAFDRNRDGSVDQNEWELARRWAERESRRRALKESPTEARNVLSRGDGQRAYILSGKSESELVARYRAQGLAGLTMLLGGIPTAVWMLLARFAA